MFFLTYHSNNGTRCFRIQNTRVMHLKFAILPHGPQKEEQRIITTHSAPQETLKVQNHQYILVKAF